MFLRDLTSCRPFCSYILLRREYTEYNSLLCHWASADLYNTSIFRGPQQHRGIRPDGGRRPFRPRCDESSEARGDPWCRGSAFTTNTVEGPLAVRRITHLPPWSSRESVSMFLRAILANELLPLGFRTTPRFQGKNRISQSLFIVASPEAPPNRTWEGASPNAPFYAQAGGS